MLLSNGALFREFTRTAALHLAAYSTPSAPAAAAIAASAAAFCLRLLAAVGRQRHEHRRGRTEWSFEFI